ncbi:MAG: hypothetical protein ABSF91_00125 [Bacteroidota bacterium]|jgi:hypothetical protein
MTKSKIKKQQPLFAGISLAELMAGVIKNPSIWYLTIYRKGYRPPPERFMKRSQPPSHSKTRHDRTKDK